MIKQLFLCAIALFTMQSLQAQKIFTRDGKVAFHSDAPLEKIEAHNHKASSVIDIESGRMEFAVLIKAFQFEKALMQEHFNENYMESTKFPKATFKGQIDNLTAIDFSTDGTYEAQISGEMTIHGVTQPIRTKGQFTVKEGVVSGWSTFTVLVADYDIEIPSVVVDNIAKEVSITVNCTYEALKG